MDERSKREQKIKEVIAKYVSDEDARAEIWAVVDDVIGDERSEAYDNGWDSAAEVYY